MKAIRIRQKLFAMLLCIALLISSVPLCALTASAVETNVAVIGDSAYYSYTVSDNGATIVGISNSISGDVVIPSELGGYPVTAISKSAFLDCTEITSFSVPDSVLTIDEGAFSGCTGLESITLPFVGHSRDAYGTYESAFGYIFGNYNASNNSHPYEIPPNLKSVTITDATHIPENAYIYCSNITEINLSDGIETIGAAAFYGCKSLTSINIPDGVTSIGAWAFFVCDNLANITLPNSVISIGKYTFAHCDGLISVTIPSSVTSIGEAAFFNCFSLENIYYGGSKNDKDNINIYAYNDCLTNATWHMGKCTNGGEHTYTGECDSVCDVCLEIRIAPLHSFDNDCDPVCEVCGEERETEHIYTDDCDATCNSCNETRENVHLYDNDCDETCNLCGKTRTVGEHIKELYTIENQPGNEYLYSDGVYYTPAEDLEFYWIDYSYFQLTITALQNCALELEYSTDFKNYDTLTITKGYNTLIETNDSTDWTTRTVYLSKGDEVTISSRIELPAEEGAVKIKLKSSPQMAAKDFVAACDEPVICDICEAVVKEVKDHTYTSDFDTKCNICEKTRILEPQSAVYDIFTYNIIPDENGGTITITDVDVLAEGEITVPDKISGFSVTAIGDRAFGGCAGITGISIPQSITIIGEYAFEGCDKLISIKIPDSVTTLSDCMFSGCTGLLELELPFLDRKFAYLFGERQYEISPDIVPHALKKVTINRGEIPEYAFDGCDSISNVIFGDGVTLIGNFACYDCNSITKVHIGNSTETVGVSAFENCVSLTSVYIGSSVTTIDFSAFKNCVSLPEVEIPDSVVKIKDNAFENCRSLAVAILGSSVEQIGNYAFHNCTSLLEIFIPDSTLLIGAHAFQSCVVLHTAIFGNSVKTIFDYAFEGCTSLKRVSLPDSTTSIGEYVFSNCSSLERATLKGEIEHINNSAFEGCTSLVVVTFPNVVTTIAYNAFNACYNLTEVWYEGTQQDRAKISVAYGNDPIKNAAWTYNWTDNSNHVYDNSCDTTCNECGEIRSINHTYVWVIDRENHCGISGIKHEECVVCHITRNENTEFEPLSDHHIFDNNIDKICNICGYNRSLVLGDTNGDGKVNIKDATLIQKAIATLITLDDSETESADVNGDGKVNIKDATTIQKYVAGIIKAF